MGISAICWTAHFQGFSFNDVGTRRSNIIDVAGRLVWSMSHNLESNCTTVEGREYGAIEHNCMGSFESSLNLRTLLFGEIWNVQH
jgi:hypothetical protein